MDAIDHTGGPGMLTQILFQVVPDMSDHWQYCSLQSLLRKFTQSVSSLQEDLRPTTASFSKSLRSQLYSLAAKSEISRSGQSQTCLRFNLTCSRINHG